MRLAIEVADLGFWEWDVDNGRLAWCRGLEKLFELEETGFCGTYDAFLKLVHPADRALVQQEIAICLVKAQSCAIEFRNLRSDGSIRWLFARGRPVWNEMGIVSRIVGIVQDVTWRE